jgi:hypothetical protein
MIDEDAGIVVGGEAAQDLSEFGGAELARSTGAGDPLGEPPDPFAIVGQGFLSQGGNSLPVRDGREFPP